MATILIVSGSYYPYATANAVCTRKFEDELRRKGHTVIYCNRKHDLYEPDYHTYEGTELYTVGKNSDLFYQTQRSLLSLSLPNRMGACQKVSYNIFRVLMKLINLGKSEKTLRTEADRHYMDVYAKVICEIVEKRKVDIILSVSMPFDSHRAVFTAIQRMKDRGVSTIPKWMAYCIDAYWSKAGIKTSDVPRMKMEERKIFDACNKILFLDTIASDYAVDDFAIFRNKISSLPLPLFDLNEVPQFTGGIDTSEHVQHWLFAGTIYDDFSNANSLVSIIRFQKNRPVKVHIMGKIYPKSRSMLETVKSEMPDQVVIYGRQSYNFAKASMLSADVLINLANDNANQIPSKIFEYMACLKPVLNIYRRSDDVGTEYLRKYPLAFNLDVNNIQAKMSSLAEWSDTLDERSTSFEELKQIFKDVLSDSVTAKFYTIIESLLPVKE